MNPADRERNLDSLFREYREACEYDTVNPNFMPMLWQRIESRRSNKFGMERLARVFASATLALAVLAGVFVSFAPSGPLEDTWVEDLANHSFAQNASYYEPVQLSPVALHSAESSATR